MIPMKSLVRELLTICVTRSTQSECVYLNFFIGLRGNFDNETS